MRFQYIPSDTDFVERASIRIVTDVVVRATPEETFAVLDDHERWPEWFPAAKQCRVTSEQPSGVGTTRWIHFDLFKVNERFIAWDPPREWAFTLLDGSLPGVRSLVERAVLEPVDASSTSIHYTIAADVAPYLKPAVPFLKWRLGSLFARGLPGITGQAAKLRG